MRKTKIYFLILISIVFFSSCILKKQSTFKNIDPSYFYHYNAIVNRNLGDITGAKNLIYEALKTNRQNGPLYYELALIKLQEDRFEESLFLLNHAKKIDTANIRNYNQLLIKIYDFTNNNDSALELLNEELIESNNPELIYKKAHFLIKSNRIQEATNLLSNQLNVSNNPAIKSFLIDIYIQTKELKQAEELLKQLEKEYPDNINAQLKLATLYSLTGEDSLSFEYYQKILFLNPNEPRALYGVILYNIEKDDRIYKKLISEYISNNNIDDQIKLYLLFDLNSRDIFYKKNRLFIDSLQTEVVNRNVNSYEINSLLFQHYLQRKNFNEAALYNERLILIDSTNFELHQTLVQIYYSIKDYEKVLKSTERAIRLFKNRSVFYLIKSLTENDLGNKEQAIKTLRNGMLNVKDKIERSDLAGTLADQYYNSKNQKLAFRLYEEAIKLNPKNYHALNNYSYFLSLEKVQLNKALKLINQVVDDNPNNSTYLDTKGWVLFKLERYDEARDILRMAIINSGSNNAVILEHYGDALYKTGNKESAYIYWLKAKEAGGNSKELLKKISSMSYVE